MAKLKKLEEEQREIMGKAIGMNYSSQDLVDVLFLQSHRSSQFAYLPRDLQDQVEEALAKAGVNNEFSPPPGKDYRTWQKELFNKKKEALRSVLSPDQLEEFELRNSPTANEISWKIKYLDTTEAEYKTILRVHEELDTSSGRLGMEAQNEKIK